MKRTVLYIGWVGFGNHGDDVCYRIFAEELGARAQSKGIDLELRALFPTSFNEYTLARLQPDLVVLGAGSLFEPVYLKPLILAQQNSIPTAIWGSGWDSLLPSPIPAERIDPDCAYLIRRVVEGAAVVGVRGPYTLEMLEKIGAHHPQLNISGDPGLLLTPTTASSSLLSPDRLGKPLIAVNWGTAGNKVLGEDEKAVAQDLAAVLSELTAEYALVIYPVWERDLAPCQKLHALLPTSDSVFCLDRVPSLEELIDLYKQSSFSINMKLHASVFSAALGTPFISLAYRMKCWDFAQSLEWQDFAILFSEERRRTRLTAAVRELSGNLDAYQSRLVKARDEYQGRLAELTDALFALLQ